jgi:hypothetical protein
LLIRWQLQRRNHRRGELRRSGIQRLREAASLKQRVGELLGRPKSASVGGENI